MIKFLKFIVKIRIIKKVLMFCIKGFKQSFIIKWIKIILKKKMLKY